MKINFPPLWGKNEADPIIVPIDMLDEFIEAVKDAGWDAYWDLKNWAAERTCRYYIWENELHGSSLGHAHNGPGIEHKLEDLIVPEADLTPILDFL